MNPETENKAAAPVAPEAASVAPVTAPAAKDQRGGFGRDSRSGARRGGPGGRRGPERAPRAKPEYDSTTLNIRRVSRTVSGGRRFAFSVAMVAGNRKGMVGVGLGKAGDTALAIDKAFRDAKKNMVKINVTKEMSIPHEVFAKYASARVNIRPVKDRGLVAGSSARTVLELAGITNVAAKIISPSKNKLNIARAAIIALQGLTLSRPTSSKQAK
ncbi:MAG: 30S ribosomal protein S5 [bacterium]|nr:30S ribosomal protein S5 [bacterium]